MAEYSLYQNHTFKFRLVPTNDLTFFYYRKIQCFCASRWLLCSARPAQLLTNEDFRRQCSHTMSTTSHNTYAYQVYRGASLSSKNRSFSKIKEGLATMCCSYADLLLHCMMKSGRKLLIRYRQHCEQHYRSGYTWCSSIHGDWRTNRQVWSALSPMHGAPTRRSCRLTQCYDIPPTNTIPSPAMCASSEKRSSEALQPRLVTNVVAWSQIRGAGPASRVGACTREL